MTLEQFRKKYETIQGRVYKSVRDDDCGGAGQTFERLLGIEENNISLPDLGKIELKVHQDNSKAQITLFTHDKDAWVMPYAKAIRKYGKSDNNGTKRFNSRIKTTPNGIGLYLDLSDDLIAIVHRNGNLLLEWEMETLKERFEQKLPAIMLVKAKEVTTGFFTFGSAILLKKPSKFGLVAQLRDGNIVVETRIKLKDGKIRNHGTAFRVLESNLDKLFDKRRLI